MIIVFLFFRILKFFFNYMIGKIFKGFVIKFVDKKELIGILCNQELFLKRVYFVLDFYIEEFEIEVEDLEMDIDKELGSISIVWVFLFYIGKLLKDYDVINGRVSCFYYK